MQVIPPPSSVCKHCNNDLVEFVEVENGLTEREVLVWLPPEFKIERAPSGRLLIIRPRDAVCATFAETSYYCPYCDFCVGSAIRQPYFGKKSYYCPGSGIAWPTKPEFVLCPYCSEATRMTDIEPVPQDWAYRELKFARFHWWLREHEEQTTNEQE